MRPQAHTKLFLTAVAGVALGTVLIRQGRSDSEADLGAASGAGALIMVPV